jgi:hypothetical protein
MIALAGCFLISSSVFAADSQLNTNAATMKPVVVAMAAKPAHKVGRARGHDTRLSRLRWQKVAWKVYATGLPQ